MNKIKPLGRKISFAVAQDTPSKRQAHCWVGFIVVREGSNELSQATANGVGNATMGTGGINHRKLPY
ncbi:Laminin subunit alpha [Trichinella spiralis]|uniref:Laminin subunit alpha n=1 Tax=Trichinella spiralis TaxID=6334 RepID=A0ABR3L1E9_TRISP